jgi:hypothetical protein
MPFTKGEGTTLSLFFLEPMHHTAERAACSRHPARMQQQQQQQQLQALVTQKHARARACAM